MSSTIVNKIESRLSALPVTASKESIQSIAQFLTFSHRHAEKISTKLTEMIQSADSFDRKWLYYRILDEVLLKTAPPEGGDASKKRDKYGSLRLHLGEGVAIEGTKAMFDACISDNNPTPTRGADEVLRLMKDMIRKWEELDVFDGPTIITSIRKVFIQVQQQQQQQVRTTSGDIAATTSSLQEIEEAQQQTEVDEDGDELNFEVVDTNNDDNNDNSLLLQDQMMLVQQPAAQKKPQQLNPEELLVILKSIATTNITRELPKDSAISLQRALESIINDDDDVTAEMKFSDAVLDIDVEESLKMLEDYKTLIKKHKKRKMEVLEAFTVCGTKPCIDTGDVDAANVCYSLGEKLAQLKRKRHAVADALALEGLDVHEEDHDQEENKDDNKDGSNDQYEFTWLEQK